MKKEGTTIEILRETMTVGKAEYQTLKKFIF